MTSILSNPAHKLTPEQLDFFHENGYVGPFQACTPEEMAGFRARIEEEVLSKVPSDQFGIKEGRDRHLDSRAIYEVMALPAIRERLVQILGPNLLVWRSSIFLKPPGAPATVWHQTNVFKEFVDDPILEPPDKDDLFQVTTWIAIDEANLENGCVQLVPGTHKTFAVKGVVDKVTEEARAAQQSNFGHRDEGFFGYDIKFDTADIDPTKVVNMQCKPGEFFIFTQRTMHGSPPNNSDRRRFGLAFRTIRGDVKAYGHFLGEGKIEHYGQTFDLTKWGCILLAGENLNQLNKIAQPPQ